MDSQLNNLINTKFFKLMKVINLKIILLTVLVLKSINNNNF